MLAFWNKFKSEDKQVLVDKIETFLYNFGTSLHCNRFDVGNCIEMAFSEFVTSMGNRVECASHAKRIDAKIDDVGEISLKYSSGGNVTLHNVRSGINADFHVHPTIVLRPNGMYFLLEEELKKRTIELKDYLVDAKSSLELKQSIFKAIETHAPVLFIPLVIRSFKKECLRKNCFEVIYNGNAILTNPCLTDEEKKTQCLDLFTRYLSSPPKANSS